jgi:hypothetical protein
MKISINLLFISMINLMNSEELIITVFMLEVLVTQLVLPIQQFLP